MEIVGFYFLFFVINEKKQFREGSDKETILNMQLY